MILSGTPATIPGDPKKSRISFSRTVTFAPFVWTVTSTLALAYMVRLWQTGQADFRFDDALMFYRYASNLRHGFGVAWNPGQPPVYGLTSLAWLFVVTIFSGLPVLPVHLLVTLSCLSGALALGVLTVLCASQHRERRMQTLPLVFSVIAIPLLLDMHFTQSLLNGMETMLALLAITLFVGMTQRAARLQSKRASLILAVVAMAAILSRPESVLIVLLFPVTYCIYQRTAFTVVTLGAYYGALAGLLLADLLMCQSYFHSCFPLAFYVKWLHGYAGYRLYLNPFAYGSCFLSMATFPLIAAGLLLQKRHLRLVMAFAIPLLVEVIYLTSVTQIMGGGGRYYIPFLPFLFVPATLLLSEAGSIGVMPTIRLSLRRAAVIAVCLFATGQQYAQRFYDPAARIVTRGRTVYEAPHFATRASALLPTLEHWTACQAVGEIVRAMPAGSTMSTSEVGLIGLLGPRVNIIDSAGLNDTEIAREGFSAHLIFDRKPDMIWMIHSDYTRDYGLLASDAVLLRDYTMYAGAFNHGVAIRKDSPFRGAIMDAFRKIWSSTYPGIAMDQTLVEQVSWNPRPVHQLNRPLITSP